MTLSLNYAVRSDVGHVREGNEDSGYAGPRLVAIADGMGGAAFGEVASRVVIGRLAELDEDPPSGDVVGALSRAILSANDDLRRMVNGDPSLAGMGTTTTALIATDQRLGLVHVGDSRCYLFRDGVLTRVTRDHTLVQELIDAGEISEEEAAVHPRRSVITRVLDGSPGVELDVSVREARVGDRYLLCSDGLSSVVSADTITVALGLPSPHEAADRLVELALRAGGPDNITVVVADVVDSNTPDAQPTIAGAAAELANTPAPSLGRAELISTSASSAGRAARMMREARGLGLRRRVQPEVTSPAPRHGRRLLIPAVLLATLLLIVVAVLGGWFYVRSQYYVGVAGSDVAIYRGLPGTVGPLHLSSVDQRGPALSTLQPEAQRQVQGRITAGSHASAERILAQVESETATTSSTGNGAAYGSTLTINGTPASAPFGSPSPVAHSTAPTGATSTATATP